MNMERQDGYLTSQIASFANYKNGYSTSCDNVNSNFTILPIRTLQPPELETVYRSNVLLRRIIDYLPQECGIYPGKTEDVSGEIDAEVLKDVDKKLRDLHATEAFIEADIYGRLYGDGFIILGIDDGGELEDEVNEENIREITWLKVRDRCELSPVHQSSSINPDHYIYSPTRLRTNATSDEEEELERFQRIHRTRILRFAGKKLPRRAFFNNGGYNDSIVQSLLNDVMNYQQAIGGGNAMLMRSGLFVYKMFGLEEYAVREDTAALQNRFEFINAGISVFKSLFIDAKKGEEAQFVTQNFGGVDKLIAMLQDHMIASSGYPKSVIMGSSNSSAFSEGGESDRFTMSQMVKRNQTFVWTPHYEQLLYYIGKSKEFNFNLEESHLTIHFPSTFQMTPKELAEIESMYATSDTSRINSGILMPQEVRESRYGSSEFSTIMTIDPDLNVDEMKAEKEESERNFEREKMEFNAANRQQNAPTANNRGDKKIEKPIIKSGIDRVLP